MYKFISNMILITSAEWIVITHAGNYITKFYHQASGTALFYLDSTVTSQPDYYADRYQGRQA